MVDFTLAIGTQDPHGFSAASEDEAIRYAVGYIDRTHADTLERRPEEALTLLGPAGLVTRPSERIDEFVKRLPGRHPGLDDHSVQTGDTNTPDCNGD